MGLLHPRRHQHTWSANQERQRTPASYRLFPIAAASHHLKTRLAPLRGSQTFPIPEEGANGKQAKVDMDGDFMRVYVTSGPGGRRRRKAIMPHCVFPAI